MTWQIQRAGLGVEAKRCTEEVYMILGWCPARGSRRALATWAPFAYKMPLVAHVGKLCQCLLSCLTLSPRGTQATAKADRGNFCPTRRPKAQPPKPASHINPFQPSRPSPCRSPIPIVRSAEPNSRTQTSTWPTKRCLASLIHKLARQTAVDEGCF